jgi:4-amino-4-deoxy-L-arabinose transferase-like glycosyltransferase
VTRLLRPLPLLALLTIVLVAFAALRGLDHDESQYVAAARLVADGLLPYRDFAYLQTPLQPFVFAPFAWVCGSWAWPALRVANALLGVVVVAASWRAMREGGADERTATICAGLLATCDVLLFSAGTARNDALPAAILACALVPMVRADRGTGTRGAALLVGALLAGAAAAKVSYAVPAAAYGLYALVVRRHRPGWVMLGALPPLVFVAWTAWLAPDGFVFGTLTFPAEAPGEYYRATGRAWKLALWAEALDVLKFLALGPALVALAAILHRNGRTQPAVLAWIAVAGFVAALIPSPTWRQYLLPALPPLFVLLALRWTFAPPSREWRIATAVFAGVGLTPSVWAIGQGGGLGEAIDASSRIARMSIDQPIVTLSPQFLPRYAPPDARFATGPFYFRSRGLLSAPDEARLKLVSRDRLDAVLADPPFFILVGGEGPWTSGDAALDRELEDWAIRHGWTLQDRIGAHLRLYARNKPPSTSRPAIAVR